MSLKSGKTRRFAVMAQRLRRARLDAGLSQQEAAKKLARPQSFISRSETGNRRIDVFELEEFAEAYGKPLQFFLKENS